MKTKQALCALLAALTLCGCAQKPAPATNAPASSAPAEEQRTPVTTEAEVRALYGADASSIVSVTPYEGDFLVRIDSACPMLDWVYGKSGVRRELMLLTEGIASVEICAAGYVKVLTDGINIFYLNIHQIYEDENHNLAKDLTFDDVHLYAQHYDKWVKYLKTHAVVKGE